MLGGYPVVPNAIPIHTNSKTQLTKWIDEVFETREDEHKRTLITNGRQKLKRNLSPSQPAGRASVKPKPDGSHTDPNTPAKSAAIATGSADSSSVPPNSPAGDGY